ncbi:DUF1569 domain-containing protein [Aureibacter tunicatorum]|uniref:DUF1569 domain-containing protein n=1 Tax=Aureibacter tunicatorum TaxID=866807 RepID=A0AAE4BUI4_9BACT|nr:DUF1569 domain-containing protein [Aureibacter tunicatorum]MDR6240792.1 hypothetical protein [Aureibacter tunicatorum]BDD06875.1 hypothetical protein AUTU_43580 [Aureibacter tunicatorum]
MNINNIFKNSDIEAFKSRLENINHDSQPKWGKMNASEMLAHLNVMFEMTYEDIHPKPNALTKFLLKLLVKPLVTGTKPYGKSKRTASQFIISGQREFDVEKDRLVNYIDHTYTLGPEYFENKESHSFGKLSSQEWNNMFSKHIDHHFTQFGV